MCLIKNINVRALVCSFIFLAFSIPLAGCTNSKKNVTIAPTPLSTIHEDVELPLLLAFYVELDENISYADLENRAQEAGFLVRLGGGNSSKNYRIGFDEEVLQEYHAKPGQYIEVSYPKLGHEFSATPEYIVYHFYGERYWTIIQLFKLAGYNSSYWDFKETGVWVRQWPTIEGNDEYTRFSTIKEAAQHVAYYRNE